MRLDRRSTTRRAFLGAVGTGAAAMATTGTAAAASGDYEHVVDVVEAGADNTGQEPIDDVLADNRADDTLFQFPEGEYLLTRQFRFSGFDRFGLVGDGATLRPAPADEFEHPPRMFKLGTYYAPGGSVEIDGFTVDFTDANTGLRAFQVQARRPAVRNVTVRGQHDSGTWGPLAVDVVDGGAIGHVVNVRLPDGGAYTANTPGDADPTVDTGPTGIIVSPSHVGKLWVRDCEVGAFPDNGLYASSTDGRVVVDGGRFANSNVANVRLSGQDSSIHNATVVVDANRPADRAQRGIRLDGGSGFWIENTEIVLDAPNGDAIRVTNDAADAKIENVSVTVAADDDANDAICVSGDAGPTTIIDSSIHVDAPGQAIQLHAGDGGGDVVENVTIDGAASGSEGGRHAVRCERDDCEFRALTVDQRGTGFRRGVSVGGDDCLVYSGEYTTTHHPIVVDDATGVRINDVTVRSTDGYAGVKLRPDVGTVDVVYSTVYAGILDQGAADLTTYGNDYPER